MERRLAAILAADVVGYSRLIEADEAGTLAALRSHREALIDPKIAQYHGRIVKLMGDGLLAEFPSAVEAVQCAVEIQHLMTERNAEVPEDRRTTYRIGINIGDIIVEDEDIFGDGVNIAARLEGLADPGGICISRPVHTQIADKLDLEFEDLGEQQVKNIAKPVMIYRVALNTKAAALVTPVVQDVSKSGFRLWPVAAMAAVLVLATGGALWWQPWGPTVEPTSDEDMAFPLPDKPSIAVLPFTNMSGDPEQVYFSDGITEDLITDLSRVSGLFVIARNSSFTYKNRETDVRTIASDLGVRYVLEGSIRRSGNQVRINTQLIDATTGGHVWADRYDRELTSVFALQDKVVQKIVTALAVRLTPEETDRLTRTTLAHPDAYDTLLRGLSQLRRYTSQTNAEARKLFEETLTLDPEYARAYAALAYSYAIGVIFGWTKTPDEDGRRALELTRTAVELDDTLPQVHFARSNAHRALKQLDEAIAAASRAIELDPNYADAYATLAITLNYAGQPEDGMEAIQTAMRLNPRYSFFEVWILAQAYYLLGRYEDAIVELEKAVESNPSFVQIHKLLAAAYGQAGRIDDAEWEAQEVLTLLPNFSLKAERQRAPYKNPGLDHYIDGLRKAGLP